MLRTSPATVYRLTGGGELDAIRVCERGLCVRVGAKGICASRPPENTTTGAEDRRRARLSHRLKSCLVRALSADCRSWRRLLSDSGGERLI